MKYQIACKNSNCLGFFLPTGETRKSAISSDLAWYLHSVLPKLDSPGDRTIQRMHKLCMYLAQYIA